jgi:hypothetical protein
LPYACLLSTKGAYYVANKQASISCLLLSMLAYIHKQALAFGCLVLAYLNKQASISCIARDRRQDKKAIARDRRQDKS